MDKATKAALFSALLFPGWGQFYLKRYKRGLVFIVPVLASALALVWSIVEIGISIIKAAPFKKGTVHPANVIQVAVDALKAIVTVLPTHLSIFHQPGYEFRQQ